MASAPSAAATQAGDLEVLALGNSAGVPLARLSYYRAWLGWRDEGSDWYPGFNWSVPAGAVSAGYLFGVDVFMLDPAGVVWHTVLHGASEGLNAQRRSSHS